MKKTYVITIEEDPDLVRIFGEGSQIPHIAALLNDSRFIHCHSVVQAPESLQPINNEGSTEA